MEENSKRLKRMADMVNNAYLGWNYSRIRTIERMLDKDYFMAGFISEEDRIILYQMLGEEERDEKALAKAEHDRKYGHIINDPRDHH